MMSFSEVVSYVKSNKYLLLSDVAIVTVGLYTLGFTTFTTVVVGVGGWYYLRCYKKVVDGGDDKNNTTKETDICLEKVEEKALEDHKWVQAPVDRTGSREERAEWINECVRNLWPFISEIIWDILKESVEPAIQEQLTDVKFDVFDLLEAFHFKTFDLGQQPVRLVGIHIVDDHDDKSKIVLDAELVYDGDAHLEAGFTVLPFGIKDIQVLGTIRIELNPILAKPPLIGGMTFYFLKDPTIGFNFTNALSIGDIPGLHGIIKKAIGSVINSFIVYPQTYKCMFGKETPSGVLRGKVVSANGLKAKDKHVFGKDSSDPYVKVKIGDFKHKTKTIENSLHPQWKDETFMLFIEKVRDQKIEFTVKDEDDLNKNDLLGKAEVELKKICHAADGLGALSAEQIDYVLRLEEAEGCLNCQLQWLRFTDDVTVIKKQIEKNSVLCVFIKLESATGLPSVEKAEGVHVELTVGETKVTSLTKKNTTRPVWNEMHYFFVHNIRDDVATFKVKASDEDDLGHFTVRLATLASLRDMEMSDSFQLSDCTTKGLLRASLDLKGLVTGPEMK